MIFTSRPDGLTCLISTRPSQGKYSIVCPDNLGKLMHKGLAASEGPVARDLFPPTPDAHGLLTLCGFPAVLPCLRWAWLVCAVLHAP